MGAWSSADVVSPWSVETVCESGVGSCAVGHFLSLRARGPDSVFPCSSCGRLRLVVTTTRVKVLRSKIDNLLSCGSVQREVVQQAARAGADVLVVPVDAGEGLGWPSGAGLADAGEDRCADLVAQHGEAGDGAGALGGNVVAVAAAGFDDELLAAQFAEIVGGLAGCCSRVRSARSVDGHLPARFANCVWRLRMFLQVWTRVSGCDGCPRRLDKAPRTRCWTGIETAGDSVSTLVVVHPEFASSHAGVPDVARNGPVAR